MNEERAECKGMQRSSLHRKPVFILLMLHPEVSYKHTSQYLLEVTFYTPCNQINSIGLKSSICKHSAVFEQILDLKILHLGVDITFVFAIVFNFKFD